MTSKEEEYNRFKQVCVIKNKIKKTTVEWFSQELDKRHCVILNYPEYQKLLEQAKAMEKEQMEKIFKQAQECAVKADGVYFKYESFEKYYEQEFKSE